MSATVRASATEAETGEAPLTAAEIRAINVDLAAKIAARDAELDSQMRARARGPAPSEPRAPPAIAPEPEANVALFDDGIPAGTLAATFKDPYVRLITATGETLIEGLDQVGDAIGKLRKEAQQLKLEVAELKAQLAETRSKADMTDFVLQRLRLENRGDVGPAGPMGRDGERGPIGPVGQTGARGSRGQPGDRIVSWRLSAEEFLAYPICETGKELPPLNLTPFFTEYHRATEASEVDLEIEQAAHSRAQLELEVERTRKGLPAR